MSVTCSPAAAEVVRIVVTSRADVAGGKAFGATGPYEKLAGRIYFEVDPALAPNKIITDIDKAPRNARGRVEFSSDFFLIKPKQIERGNGTVVYEVSNRGGKGMLAFYNQATGSLDPTTEAQMGDGFLMTQGFTLLWVGWQFDPPHREGLVRVYAPIATDNGKPITGIVRSEVIVAKVAFDASLADRDHIAYTVANPNDPANTLTVRDTIEGARRFIPKSEWKLDGGRVYLTGGFQPGKIYEVVYRAQDPPVAGVGAAAVRDAISHLKFASADVSVIDSRRLDSARDRVRRISERTFSADLPLLRVQRRRTKPQSVRRRHGARRRRRPRELQPALLTAFPRRPSVPEQVLPDRYLSVHGHGSDGPSNGRQGGLLLRVKPEFTPKIFYTNSSYRYWGRAASLIHTGIDGRTDAPVPDSTRIYVFAGGQHGPAAFPPRKSIGQNPNNPNDYRWSMRALLVGMNRWIKDGVAPPASRHPRIEDKTLVQIDAMNFRRSRASGNRRKRTRPIACSTGSTSRRRGSSASIRQKRTARSRSSFHRWTTTATSWPA